MDISYVEANRDLVWWVWWWRFILYLFWFGRFSFFTLTFNQNEDDKIYFEFNEQTFSIESNDVAYNLIDHVLSFDFGEDIQESLKIKKHIEIDIDESINMMAFRKTLENIFMAKEV